VIVRSGDLARVRCYRIDVERDDVLASVCAVVGRTLPGELPEDTSAALADYGLDSMGSVELVLNLEDHFGVYFDEVELQFTNFVSIDSIAALISAKKHDVPEMAE
jgi:acyl carrier protein